MSYSEQVLQLIEEGKLDKVEATLDKALKNDSTDYLEALYNELFYLGFLEEVKIILKHLQEENNNPAYQIALAEVAIEDNELDEALDYLLTVPKNSEYYIESLMVAADVYQVLGMPEVSISKLQEAIKLTSDADDLDILNFALAELLYATGEYNQAIPIYKDLLTKGHQILSDISITERLGISLSIIGEFEEAVTYLEDSLTTNRGDDQLFYLGYTYLQLGENEKAIQLLEELRTVNSTYQSLYYYLAEALKAEERLEEALDIALQGIKIDPYQSKLYQLAAEIMYRNNDVEKAKEYLQEALNYDQGDASAQTLANLLISEEEYEEAIKIIEKMQEIDGYSKWLLAKAYEGLEEDQKAEQFYEEAQLEMGHDSDFMKDYGMFLREIGEREKSKLLLTRYLEHVPDDLEVTEILADLTDNDYLDF